MELLDNMKAIEAAQTELGYFLVSMMPVPWKKICFYARCARGFAQTWFGLIEAETGVICARDFFWKRYDSTPISERDVMRTLPKLALALYQAYLERFGEEKIWRLMFLTIESDGRMQIDFEYENLQGNSLEQHDEVFRRFFGSEYHYYWTKYPSTEIKSES
ncbi:MAG: DUF600 family protein [Oscillospiraceae bacterium]|nr:DUF600 family protein [Oscillospiraceae bacterium]